MADFPCNLETEVVSRLAAAGPVLALDCLFDFWRIRRTGEERKKRKKVKARNLGRKVVHHDGPSSSSHGSASPTAATYANADGHSRPTAATTSSWCWRIRPIGHGAAAATTTAVRSGQARAAAAAAIRSRWWGRRGCQYQQRYSRRSGCGGATKVQPNLAHPRLP